MHSCCCLWSVARIAAGGPPQFHECLAADEPRGAADVTPIYPGNKHGALASVSACVSLVILLHCFPSDSLQFHKSLVFGKRKPLARSLELAIGDPVPARRCHSVLTMLTDVFDIQATFALKAKRCVRVHLACGRRKWERQGSGARLPVPCEAKYDKERL